MRLTQERPTWLTRCAPKHYNTCGVGFACAAVKVCHRCGWLDRVAQVARRPKKRPIAGGVASRFDIEELG